MPAHARTRIGQERRGTSAKGITAFINSTSLIGDLGTSYVASWLGNLITIGAMISAFSCALASAVGAARPVYAMSRDGILVGGLSRVSGPRRTPLRETGPAAVRDHLKQDEESRRKADLNSWQAACYSALAASDWFCAGGFRY